ncbi:long polar fimbrial protein LpfD [Enterobacter sp.]|uniref:long polar fimbrial protein LpfD n=1 Tax=Enterobacter sp. TaxID=42895 RepID=UPI002981E8AD|nr:long polar fimbrial protein LpfD [Enterobacter sp.]
MFKKRIVIAGVLGMGLFSAQALADGWGPCETIGGTHQFNATLEKQLSDPSQNRAGTTVTDFADWNGGNYYHATCQCPDDTSQTAYTYFKAVSPIADKIKVSDRIYYKVNDNIAFAANVWLAGGVGEYLQVPFDDISNESRDRGGCKGNENANWSSGSIGKLSLYIVHPFVGETEILNTRLVDVYATMSAGNYSQPITSVYISGRVTVSQSCALNNGNLDIPLGEYASSDFKDRKGAKPDGVTVVIKELQFKCANVSDGIKVFLRIEGKVNDNDPNAIDVGNPDVGVIVESAQGILIPNDASSVQEMAVEPLLEDGIHRVAKTKISAYPISTTGALPAGGNYEGVATLLVEVE